MNEPTRVQPIATNPFKRLLFMALLFGLFGLVRLMLWAVVAFQFLAHFFSGKVPGVSIRWGRALSGWIHGAVLFMSYNTERIPFPFAAFGADED